MWTSLGKAHAFRVVNNIDEHEEDRNASDQKQGQNGDRDLVPGIERFSRLASRAGGRLAPVLLLCHFLFVSFQRGFHIISCIFLVDCRQVVDSWIKSFFKQNPILFKP